MSLYAWKVMAPAGPPHEKIGTLDALEAYLDASGLPSASPAKPIVERTRMMQSEGQGYYKEPTNGEGWSLLWVELRTGDRRIPRHRPGRALRDWGHGHG